MNLEQAQQLDAWLAAREVTGERFGVGRLVHGRGNGSPCAIGALAIDDGFTEAELNELTTLGYFTTPMAMNPPLVDRYHEWLAGRGFVSNTVPSIATINDESGGDPAAIRAELHRVFTQLAPATTAPLEAVCS